MNLWSFDAMGVSCLTSLGETLFVTYLCAKYLTVSPSGQWRAHAGIAALLASSGYHLYLTQDSDNQPLDCEPETNHR